MPFDQTPDLSADALTVITAIERLIAQGHKATSAEGTCQYGQPGTARCIVGHMSDKSEVPDWVQHEPVVGSGVLEALDLKHMEPHLDFMEDLQRCAHDSLEQISRTAVLNGVRAACDAVVNHDPLAREIGAWVAAQQ